RRRRTAVARLVERGGAANRRARAAGRPARAVGLHADQRAALGGMDPPPPLGIAMSVKDTKDRIATTKGTKAAVTCAAFVCACFAPSVALSGDRYALVITGASGGDAYAQKYLTWRVQFTTTLRETFHYPPDPVITLA